MIADEEISNGREKWRKYYNTYLISPHPERHTPRTTTYRWKNTKQDVKNNDSPTVTSNNIDETKCQTFVSLPEIEDLNNAAENILPTDDEFESNG